MWWDTFTQALKVCAFQVPLFLIHWQLIQGYRQLLSNLLKHLGVKLPGTTWWRASSFLGKVTETAAVLPTFSQLATLWQKTMY